ncbi:hypothetical protein LTR62_007166 [Meristemomyces frigidus]|uniref:Uncharacterized protein n=1 Tax=Meristemomyces frigidus TaxID=1508187 RepID=A0AAN7YI21_9PEZI|nr:hypothetical protein LTR62_007166 [Meristemomyces frigidus]
MTTKTSGLLLTHPFTPFIPTIQEPPHPNDPQDRRTSNAPLALQTAIDKIILAIATLHRLGPHYEESSTPLWHFAAGSMLKSEFEERVEKTGRELLPPQIGVREDLVYVEGLVAEALGVLRREGDWRDEGDLVEGLAALGLGGWGW